MRQLALGMVVIFSLSLSAGCRGPKSVCGYPPAEPQEAAGEWVGMDSDDLQFWRLDLRSDFTGYLACGQEAWGFEAYRVSHWTLNSDGLVTEIKPIGTNAEPIYLKGIYSGSVLDLEVGGMNGGWKLLVTLYREPRIEEYNRQAREKILEVETK